MNQVKYYVFENEVRIDAPLLRGITIAKCPNAKVAQAVVNGLDWADSESMGYNAEAWKEALYETPNQSPR